MSIFLLILSYFIGLAAQTEEQSIKIGDSMYKSSGYSWFYPITNCFYWFREAITSLLCAIGTCIGLGFYISNNSKFTNGCLEDMITHFIGGVVLTFVSSYLYGILMYIGFDLTKNSSVISIIIGFLIMMWCNLIMGSMAKYFTKYEKDYKL